VENEGVKILFLSPEVVQRLRGMVIDYQETPQGGGFTISKITPE
jgi:Fe-S cluster assembly iron-binding protein IscA